MVPSAMYLFKRGQQIVKPVDSAQLSFNNIKLSHFVQEVYPPSVLTPTSALRMMALMVYL